ncbi:MAG: type II and III secretion system protein [Elusimicrobiota bacterium]|nr:MAG: type II and III secretion system protein [Elusimicrobiota bacterium]
MIRQLWTATALLCALAATASAQPEDSLIAVSADIVEISGSVQRDIGFAWTPFQAGIGYAEKQIAGLYHVGDFARQTQLQTQLKMLETEGKAQLLSNPKVVVQAQSQANFVVGGEVPYPSANGNGTVTADFKKFGVILNIVPVINPNKKDTIRAELQLEVSNVDFSKTVQVGNTAVPSIVTRQIQTAVEIKSGETLVIGGLKSSAKNVSKSKVPFLGSIPVLGLLFTTTTVVEEQKSLFLFITMEIVK